MIELILDGRDVTEQLHTARVELTTGTDGSRLDCQLTTFEVDPSIIGKQVRLTIDGERFTYYVADYEQDMLSKFLDFSASSKQIETNRIRENREFRNVSLRALAEQLLPGLVWKSKRDTTLKYVAQRGITDLQLVSREVERIGLFMVLDPVLNAHVVFEPGTDRQVIDISEEIIESFKLTVSVETERPVDPEDSREKPNRRPESELRATLDARSGALLGTPGRGSDLSTGTAAAPNDNALRANAKRQEVKGNLTLSRGRLISPMAVVRVLGKVYEVERATHLLHPSGFFTNLQLRTRGQ